MLKVLGLTDDKNDIPGILKNIKAHNNQTTKIIQIIEDMLKKDLNFFNDQSLLHPMKVMYRNRLTPSPKLVGKIITKIVSNNNKYSNYTSCPN